MNRARNVGVRAATGERIACAATRKRHRGAVTGSASSTPQSTTTTWSVDGSTSTCSTRSCSCKRDRTIWKTVCRWRLTTCRTRSWRTSRSIEPCSTSWVGSTSGSSAAVATRPISGWRAEYQGYALGFAPAAVVHYRYRQDMRGFCKHFGGYAEGTAKLRQKHESLGALVPQTPYDRRRKAWRYLKRAIHVEAADRTRGALSIHEPLVSCGSTAPARGICATESSCENSLHLEAEDALIVIDCSSIVMSVYMGSVPIDHSRLR